jgi:hypothetical protein
MARGAAIWQLSVAAFAAGCRVGMAGDRLADSAGVTIGVAAADEREAPWDAAVVGAMAAGRGALGEVTVERPEQVATDGDERIYVLDDLHYELLAFSADGRELWRRGRNGGAPGEFRRATFVRVTDSGEVQVTDQAKLALVRYERDGAALSDLPISQFGYPHSAVYVRADTAVLKQLEPSGWVLRKMVGATVTEIARASITSLGTARFTCAGGTFSVNDAPRLLAPAIAWTASNGRIAVAVESEYAIRIYLDGMLIAIARRELPRHRTTLNDLKRVFGDTTYVGRRECRVPVGLLASQFGYEPFLPLLRGVGLGPDGSLWVERFTLPDEPTRIDVFAASMDFVGTVAGVGRLVGFLSGGRLVTLRAKDEPGLYQVVVSQLTPPPW